MPVPFIHVFGKLKKVLPRYCNRIHSKKANGNRAWMCKYFVKMETTERIIHLLPRWGLDALRNRGYKPLPQEKRNT